MRDITFLCLLVLILIQGCSNSIVNNPESDDPYYAPIYTDQTQKTYSSGSIYSESNAISLYSDIKAYRVGDIVHVVLKEKTNASKNAKNNLNSTTDISSPSGLDTGVIGVPLGERLDTALQSKKLFNGKSDSEQKNNIEGSISVNVVQVLNNGNLVVRGEKWITINDDQEFIRLTGIIRTEDISRDNKIDSTKIANARIEYSGSGSFHESQTTGWLSRFFMGKWWFL